MFYCCCFDCINSLHCLWCTSGNSNRVWRTPNNKYHYLPQPDWLIRIIIDFILGCSLHCRSPPLTMSAFDYCSWLMLVVEFDLIAHFCYCLHSLLLFQQMICILSVFNVIRFLFALSSAWFVFIPWVLIAIEIRAFIDIVGRFWAIFVCSICLLERYRIAKQLPDIRWPFKMKSSSYCANVCWWCAKQQMLSHIHLSIHAAEIWLHCTNYVSLMHFSSQMRI